MIVRPTRMGDGPRSGNWTIDPPSGSMAAIPKADVAAFMVEQLESDAYA